MTQNEFQQITANLPGLPGIYKYYNELNELLYVGKAKNIRKRVSSYFNKTLASYKTHELVKRIKKNRIHNSEFRAGCFFIGELIDQTIPTSF